VPLSILAGLASKSGGSINPGGQGKCAAAALIAACISAPCLLPWLSAFDMSCWVSTRYFPMPRVRSGGKSSSITGTGRPGRINGKDATELHRDAAARRHRTGVALSPKMLLLDEPFGIARFADPDWNCRNFAGGLAREENHGADGHHDVDEALFLSDRIAMMTKRPGGQGGGYVCRFPSRGHAIGRRCWTIRIITNCASI